MSQYLVIFAITFAVSLLMTPFVRTFSTRAGIIDHPNHIKRHGRPIPNAGGLAIFTAFLAGLLFMIYMNRSVAGELKAVIAGAVLSVFLGLWDDIKGIYYIEKLILQAAVALVLIFSGIRVGFLPYHLSVVITLFWIVGVTNAVNLQDGMDGLAAGTSFLAGFAFFLIGLLQGNLILSMLSLALMGSCLGFLRYNFPPASIFMGDTGSMFLGYTLAVLGVLSVRNCSSFNNLFIPVLILGVPVLDTITTIIRRFVEHRGIFDGDKGHFYDILADRVKLRHEFVLFIIYALTIILGVTSLCLV
jgi:UDP-GlcNAc:undecaprenyl-phosphate GlcNAc-1-phosphate transferase